jgi:hypothetical protein
MMITKISTSIDRDTARILGNIDTIHQLQVDLVQRYNLIDQHLTGLVILSLSPSCNEAYGFNRIPHWSDMGLGLSKSQPFFDLFVMNRQELKMK